MDFVVEPRLTAPPLADGEIVVESPPDLPPEPAGGALSRLLPVAMVVATVGMMALYFTSGASTMRNPMYLFFPAMMLVSLIGTVAAGGRGGSRTAEINRNRREYLCYLATVASRIAETAEQQRLSQEWHGPDPTLLWTLIGTRRMWERRSGEPDFGYVRIGLGPLPLSTPLVAPDLGPPEKSDPVTSGEVRRLIRLRSSVPDQPICIGLAGARDVTVEGDPAQARDLLRAVVCQLALMHAPRDLRIAAVIDPLTAAAWDWLKWLPHHLDPRSTDDGGATRLTFSSLVAAQRGLVGCGEAHVVLVVDGGVQGDGRIAHWRREGTTSIRVAADPDDGAAIHLAFGDDGLRVTNGACDDLLVRSDAMTAEQSVTFARRMCPYTPVTPAAAAEGISSSTPWADLVGIDDIDGIDGTDLAALRRRHGAGLSVPIGVSEHGVRIELDIKEAAAGGMGPHGLCIGATGSGKSEFLRTLTLGMLTTHTSEMLNLILVDFKGGATFLGFERAPHVAAVITNLADEAPLVARMRDALAGEVNRRQELLRAAGNFASVADYNTARAKGAGLAPLPALLLIVDEFSELLTQHPDFIDLFIAIGRLGRSLGMHLLLASQRVDEGRLRGLDSHLSYRVCLRTFSAAESRSVLGVPDAYHLPNSPGAAYLKTGAADPVRLQTAFVSRPYIRSQPRESRRETPPRPLIYTAAPMGVPVSEFGDAGQASSASSRTVIDAVLDRLEGTGPAAHRVWLPPLTQSPSLETLLQRVGSSAPLTVPIGLVDCPYEQRRDVLVSDLSGAAGNVAVVGGPRSGKSMVLQTLLLALAETHDPRDVQFYCLDFGGGSLSSLATLPHVGSVAGRRDVELVRRTVVQLESLLRLREARRGSAVASAAPDDDPYGEVFLVVDGWAVIRQEFDALESSITALAAQGLSYGIHVMVAASRWAEIRSALKDQTGTRIELRLGDPAESEMDRKRARQLMHSPAGHGITRDGRQFVVAASRFDSATGDRLRARFSGRVAPRIEVLPTHIDRDVLLARCHPGQSEPGLVLGVAEPDLTPLAVEFGEESHLIVLGQGECGKTNVLRTLCREIVRTNDAHPAQLFVVDFRRTLLGVVDPEHLAAYVPSAAALTPHVAALTERLLARTPGPDVDQEQLRARSWWSGPEIYVVVDDYDLVATSTGTNPLSPLIDFLPYAKDLGLHLVVARRSGGAARALFDPVLARLRDLGCMGLMMSASPDEGVLLGAVRPSQLPPGRGTMVSRAQPDRLVQIAWTEPA